jgi:hypothetical protein
MRAYVHQAKEMGRPDGKVEYTHHHTGGLTHDQYPHHR